MQIACFAFMRAAEWAQSQEQLLSEAPDAKLYLNRLISFGTGYAEAADVTADWLRLAQMAFEKGNVATAKYVQSVLVGENDSV
jgi:hypothetical protein